MLVVGFVQVVGTNLAGHHHGASPMPTANRHLDLLANLLLALGPFALLWRRSAPVPVLAVVFGAIFGYRMADYPEGPIWIALIVAFVAAVQYGPRWAYLSTMALGYLGLLWAPSLAGVEPYPSGPVATGVAAWVLVLFAASEGLKTHRERRAEAAHVRETETQRRVSEERLRIARELHDVLAHNISVINVQAGVALHLIDEHPEQGKAALQTIKQASKETLQELRSVLGVLRRVDEDLPRSPAPSIARLDELVTRAQATGMTVHTEVSGDPRPLPAGVDLAAYRILQEALTNVTKHAGPAVVRIELAYGSRDLSILVEDDGSGVALSPSPGGNGIAGMRERAAALGGELHIGPIPGGGFRVQATLPLGGAS